jgi:hypothetical protein
MEREDFVFNFLKEKRSASNIISVRLMLLLHRYS